MTDTELAAAKQWAGGRIADNSTRDELLQTAYKTDDYLVKALAEIEHLKDVLHRDRSGLAAAVEEVWQTAGGYAWVATGRGPYEYDDEEYRAEMGRMVLEIVTLCSKALRESGDTAHAECCGRGRK